jgi:hypothetical protein
MEGRVTVVRVAAGRLSDRPEYWDGDGWSSKKSSVEPIIERRTAARKCVTDCNSCCSSWIDGQNLGGLNNPLIFSLAHNR